MHSCNLLFQRKDNHILKYRDHAYHNLESKDTDEVPDFVSRLGSSIVHGIVVRNDPKAPNTGEMVNYPPNIKGDVSKTIVIPYSEFPSSLKKRINDRIPIKSGEKSQTSSLASQASSAVGLNPQQKRKRGIKTESTTWSRLQKHR